MFYEVETLLLPVVVEACRSPLAVAPEGVDVAWGVKHKHVDQTRANQSRGSRHQDVTLLWQLQLAGCLGNVL